MPPLFLRASFLLALCVLQMCRAAPPDLCLSEKGWVTAIARSCPPGTSPFRGIGVNLFDILWGAWGTGGKTANLSTSLHAIQDAVASGISFGRVFAAPWAYTQWQYLSNSTAYWQASDAVFAEAERLGLKLVPSLSHGCPDTNATCNPAMVLYKEPYHDFIARSSSKTRGTLFQYYRDFVGRYKSSPSVLFWELGNEMNLAMDGCTYDKSDGAFFTTLEALNFLSDAAAVIKAVDPERPVNTGMGSPRARAWHLMNTTGGGRACVSAENPKGDCDLACPAVPDDTREDTAAVLQLYYRDRFDIISSHYYGCAPPYGNYSWCTTNASLLPLELFVEQADAMSKPLFVGEFGPHDLVWGNTSASDGAKLIAGMAEVGVKVATLWAWECPSHENGDQPNACLHPGRPSAQPATFFNVEAAHAATLQMQGLPTVNRNASIIWLPDPQNAGDPACLDSSRYGYYALRGRENKWLVSLGGGGWCVTLEECFDRTQPHYQGGVLGSSKNWANWSFAFDFGPQFDGWSYLELPYCSGDSYTGNVDHPVPYNASVNLFIRGNANLRAALSDAKSRFGISEPDEVLVTGGSAGGLSTTLHVDYIGEFLQAKLTVGAPSCGYFIEHDAPCAGPTHSNPQCNTTGTFKNLTVLANSTPALIPACLADHPNDAWRCLMAPTVTQYVKAPLFISQSKFDHFQLSSFLSVDCSYDQSFTPPWNQAPICSPAETAAILAYGAEFMAQFEPLLATPGLRRGVYLTSCVLHGMDYHFVTVGDTVGSEELGTPINVAFNLWHQAIVGGEASQDSFKWVEDLKNPRVSNPLACPPFVFQS
jgi:Pectinacetylesterase